jgi:hypothetical protein
MVPETVYEEVEAGGVPDVLSDLSYEPVEADGSRVVTEELGAGERAAIAVAEQRGIVLLTKTVSQNLRAGSFPISVKRQQDF